MTYDSNRPFRTPVTWNILVSFVRMELYEEKRLKFDKLFRRKRISYLHYKKIHSFFCTIKNDDMLISTDGHLANRCSA